MFAPEQDITLSDLTDQQFVRRAYAAPEKLPPGMRLTSTAVADLMEGGRIKPSRELPTIRENHFFSPSEPLKS